MGEVPGSRHAADRLVAIKPLRAERTADATRLRRFEQESKAISSAQSSEHCDDFSRSASQGARFIVLEYVNGQTSGHRIGGRQGLEAIAPDRTPGGARWRLHTVPASLSRHHSRTSWSARTDT
jgi:hypothetical protein